MRMSAVFTLVFVFFIAAAAPAQTKFSGTQQCAKPDPEYAVPVGDRPDHMMSLVKDKCTWAQAEIGGVQLKDEDDTIVSDITSTRSRDHGMGVAVLASGDKAFVQFQGSGIVKHKKPVNGESTRISSRGTGKWMGLEGKGTYTGK